MHDGPYRQSGENTYCVYIWNPLFEAEYAGYGCLSGNVIESGHSIQLITANPIMVMEALENPKFMSVMKQADLIIPDGTGIVWAANYVGDPVAERVTGFDLLHELMKAGEVRRWKVFLLGSAPDVVHAAAERLRQQYPLVEIVGVRDGFFGEAEDEAVIQSIREAAPDILFVARGLDTQEPWIAKYRHELQVPLMMGVGKLRCHLRQKQARPGMDAEAAAGMALPPASGAEALRPDAGLAEVRLESDAR